MGQTTSSPHGYSPGSSFHRTSSRKHTLTTTTTACHHNSNNHHQSCGSKDILTFVDPSGEGIIGQDEEDYISELPDECLALIFQSLSSGDRKRCSLVCRRWLVVEGQSRHRLALNAKSDILPDLPSIFTRFDSVTKLALRCDRKSISLSDDAFVLISLRCPNLTRLKLRGCRELTDLGMSAFAQNCKSLKKFSCGSCMFGAKGMNALLNHCSSLEELSVKRLRGINDGGVAAEPIGPGAAATSLKSICLKELYNGQCFGPLIIGSKNLKTLKLLRCLGDWDRLLETITDRENLLFEVHLERLQVSDIGLRAISRCPQLEILHIVKAPECSNDGLVAVAENCKLLRKVHIDGWRINRIGDEGLAAIAKNSMNLQELVLIGVNPSVVSVTAIASNCQKLERLALCGSESIGDDHVARIAEKCVALKKLCIKSCHNVSYQGIEAFAWGCPNLVKIKVKKCRYVTADVADWLRSRRGSLAVTLDLGEVRDETMDASASDVAQDEGVEFQADVTGATAPVGIVGHVVNRDAPSTSNGVRSSGLKSRFSLFGGRSLVACTFRRWSNGNGNGNSNDSF